jgi:RNA polymerase sigma factor (sigma-70 family)
VRQPSTVQIISGIAHQDPLILQWIYDRFNTQIRSMVLNNSGTIEDAEDLFQNTIIAIYQKAINNTLEITSGFSTFFQAVSYRIWLNELRKRRREQNRINSLALEEDATYQEFQDLYDEVHYYGIYQKHFQQLSPTCKKILTLFLEKKSIREIAEAMGGKSEQYIRQQKFKCKERLAKNIKNDPDYQRYYENNL